MRNELFKGIPAKKMTMPQRKMQQWEIETNTWKRLLNFFREENIHSKNRLSDILKDGFERHLLGDLEDFHNHFIKHDEIMGLLRNEIAELDKMLLHENVNEGINPATIERKLDNLRHNLADAGKGFCELQLDFNKYLAEKIV